MRTYMGAHGIPGPWPAGERVLVCLGPGPLAEKLVRAGRRLASSLEAEWIVLFVETAEYVRLAESERERLARALRLAEELGARTVTLTGVSPPQEVVRYARAHNVTKILAGTSRRPWWERLLRGSLVDWIIRYSGEMDVYVISAPVGTPRPARNMRPLLPATLGPYGLSALIVALMTGVSALVYGQIGPANLTMVYLLGIVIVALQWGRGPAVLAAALSVTAFDFFFVPPRFTMAVADKQYLLTFAGLLLVGLVISALASRVREQVHVARERQASTAALLALSSDLAATSDERGILEAVARHVASVFTRDVAIFLPVQGEIEVALQSGHFPLTESERAAATWVLKHGKPAGRGTETLQGAGAGYLPLKTAQGVRGVLGVWRRDAGDQLLSPDQRRLLEAFASQAALAIERAQLAAEARRVQVLQETERLQTALLNAISHDLRAPLASITSSLGSLGEDCGPIGEGSRRDLLDTAKEGAERLNRLVADLLDMTRLEGGALRLRKEPTVVRGLVGAALTHLGDATRGRDIQVDIPEELPAVPVDAVLMTRVLVNLLDNAIRYSAPGSPVEIHARTLGDDVQIEVADRGPGIPEADLPRVFDRLSWVSRTPNGGPHPGLAICKGFVEAHGGAISAKNRLRGGLRVLVSLPLGKGTSSGEG
jgi:two-component system sensor histidine kinase KdpD